MKKKILGTYIVRKSGNANSVTIPANSGFKKGDSVIVMLEPNGNIEIKKGNQNFWDSAPVMTEQEKREQIEDLGYNPLEQQPKNKEMIEE